MLRQSRESFFPPRVPLARAGAYKVRVFSASPTAETRAIQFSANGRARLVDLAGRPVKRAGLKRSRDGAITLGLKPFELVTFEVRPHLRDEDFFEIDRHKD